MSTSSFGVCGCSGELKQTTYEKVWGKITDNPHPKSVLYQCDECGTVYMMASNSSATNDVQLTEVKSDLKDFGYTNGKRT